MDPCARTSLAEEEGGCSTTRRVVEADAWGLAEGNTGTFKAQGGTPGTSNVSAPPGSSHAARRQGLPRNLGDLVISGGRRERARE